jgi:hypothetical protein
MIVALAPYVIRGIPIEARIGLANHSLRLFGSVIRDSGTGRIVYHLQEAAPLLGKLSGLSMNPAATLGLEAVGIVQNEVNRRAIKQVGVQVAALEGLAQLNLAVSAAGIGVSALGFAIIVRRLDRIETNIGKLETKIDTVISLIDEAARRETQDLLSHVRGLAELYENSWALTDAGKAEIDLQRIWQDGSALQDKAEWRARHALANPSLGYEAAQPFLDAFAVISGLRIAALMACDEVDAAKRVERDSAEKLQRMTGGLGLVDLVPVEMQGRGKAGSSEWLVEKARATKSVTPILSDIRMREQALATRTAALAVLDLAKVRPREWLAEAREETEAEVLVLALR